MPKNEKSSTIRSNRSRTSRMHQFQGARNVIITGGNFRQIQGDSNDGDRDLGLEILRQHIAADAIYNSAERFPPPKCHPGTREKVMTTVIDWVNDPAPDQSALWLYGPAGAGKSAIAHSIAVLLQEIEKDSNYAASFFFARDAIGRGEGTKLFTTIAYQLALKYPSVRSRIDAAMIDNPTLPTKSIDVQLRYLIVEPLLRATEWPAHNPTVIIDGLDECSGSKFIQSEILLLISQAILEHHIPLRFLIASRPEYWISDSFEIGVLAGVTKPLSLRDDKDANREIEKYLREGFDDIYNKNIRIMSSIQRPWPPDHIIARFVREASGQFVYASTVLQFVGNSSNFCDPRDQLYILTTPGTHRASAFSDLDKLYATILSAYPRIDTLKLVLGGILVRASEKTIQEFLGVEAGEIQLVLSALSSLVKISGIEYDEELRVLLEPVFGSPLVESEISFCHLSFREFLTDETRSGGYTINTEAIYEQITRAIFKHGIDILQGSSEADQTIARIGVSAYRRILSELPNLCRCDFLALASLSKRFNLTLQRLLSSSPSHLPHAHHVFWFTTSAQSLFLEVDWEWRTEDMKGYKKHQDLLECLVDGLYTASAISAKQLLRSQLKNTPTFTYLASYQFFSPELHYIPDISDVMSVSLSTILSDLQHHRNLIYLDFNRITTNPCLEIHTGGLFTSHLYDVEHQNQHVAEWSRRKTNLSAQCFAKIFHNDNEQPLGPHRWNDNKVPIACYFLECGRFSNIHTKEYFKDPDKMAIFNILMDTSFWDSLDNTKSISLATSALCWFNRQMTGMIKDVIAEHDASLPPRMLSAMRRIFEQTYLPHFTSPYCSNLWMYSDHDDEILSVYLHPIPPSDEGSYTYPIMEERYLVRSDLPTPYIDALKFHLRITTFNDEVLNGGEGSSIISPADWYPHLTSFLLTMLVKKQYASLDKRFEGDSGWRVMTATCFLPLIKSLPYAYPTQQNLNALRALHYLAPKITREWRPPFGFCSLAMEFLKKYDRSLLSSQESDRLQDWLLGLSARESRRILDSDNDSVRTELDDEYTTDEDSELGDESMTDEDV